MSADGIAGLWVGMMGRACWQGGLFILGAAAISRQFPRLPTAVRCWLWWLACLKLLCGLVWIAPLSLMVLPAPAGPAVVLPPPAPWPTRAPLAMPTAPTAKTPERVAGLALTPAPIQPMTPVAPGAAGRTIPPAPRHSRLPAALLAIWMVGLAWRLAGTGRQWQAARRLARAGRLLEEETVREETAALAAALGLRHPPPLREAAAAPGPLVLGFLRPTILLPPGLAARLSSEELRLALAHELAHVARGDLWLSVVPALAQSLFFFHPLVGLACREWATAREAACDAAALALTGAPARTYGRLLLKLATASAGSSAGIASALGASLRADTLRRRIALLRQFGPPSRRRLWAGLAVLAAVGILGLVPWRLTASEPAPRERAVLAGVSGLKKPVTYSETKIPLGELVRKVATDTGVSLTAAPEVADEPVAVVVNDYPARELLQQLADLLDYQWSRRRFRRGGAKGAGVEGYQIYQDLASKQREEALRSAALAGIEQRFRDELARDVALASHPEEIDRILDEAVKRDEQFRQMTPDQKQAAIEAARHPSPQEQERDRLAAAASRIDSPIPQALALLVGRLSDAQWESLWSGHRAVFSTRPQPGELRLPALTENSFRTAKPLTSSRRFGWALAQAPDFDEIRRRQAAMLEQWSASTDYQVTIRMQADRFDVFTPIQLNAEAVPLQNGTPTSRSGFWGINTGFSVNARVGLNNLPEEVDSQERKAQLEKDRIVGVKKPFHPQAKPHVNVLGPDSGTMYAWGDLLAGLARTYGVQVISDAYWTSSGLIGSEFAGASAPTPLYALLDRRSAVQRWDRRGSLIRLRSRTWFFERPREVPLRLVRRWQALVEQKGALSLDEYAAIAVGLSDAQRDSLFNLGMATGLPEELRGLQWAPFTLQLYAALTPTQRQALGRGAAVPVAQMTPAERELFQKGLEMVQDRSTAWSLVEMAAAHLSLTAQPMVRIVAAREGASTERLEPEPAGPTGSAAATGATARTLSSGASGPGGEKRYPVLRISFKFQVGAEKPAVWSLTVAMPDRS